MSESFPEHRIRFNLEAWVRTAALAIAILTPGYFAYANLRDTVLLLSERSDVNAKRLDRLETAFATMAERQSLRVPLFDEMVATVKDHEKRLRELELEVIGRRHP